MSNWMIYSIGFIAQILFSFRVIIQWIVSEREKKIVTPSIFWKFSLIASFLMFVYGYLRHDFAIMLGQSLTYFIYIRNIQLQNDWKKLPIYFRLFLLIFPLLIVIYYYNNNTYDLHNLFKNEAISLGLLIWGVVAQIIFTFRFIYQWLYSEKKKESLLPLGFWILSFIGSLMILIYAIFRKDPVLLISNIFAIILYARNLILSLKSYK